MDKSETMQKLLNRNSGLRYSPYYQQKYGITEEEFSEIMEQLVFDGIAHRKDISAVGRVNFDPEYYLK